MTSAKLMKAGAIAGIVLAVVAVLVSDMHSVPDLVITVAQRRGNMITLPEGLAFPYWVAGAIGEPVLIVSIVIFGLGFLAAWRQTGERAAKAAAIVAFVYAAERIFWMAATLNYAVAVGTVQATSDLSSLALPGMLKGIAALIAGITAGIVMASFLMVYFSRTGIALGKTGGLLVVLAVPVGIVVKTLTLWVWPYEMTVIFMLSMGAKSVGIALMSIALYQQAGNLSRPWSKSGKPK